MGATAARSSAVWRAHSRDWTLIALTVLTGATDAVAFLSLGGVFTSVMTGNMVLMGVGVGRGEPATIVRTLFAFAGYAIGAMGGGVAAGKPRAGDPLWPRVLTTCLAVEFGLYLLYAVAWWCSGSEPSSTVRTMMLFVLATALGLQSSAVLRLGVPGLSTTYLTGTLTQVLGSVASRRSVRGVERSIGCLIALIVGAVAGAAEATWRPDLAPLAPLVLIGSVLVVVIVLLHRADPSTPALSPVEMPTTTRAERRPRSL